MIPPGDAWYWFSIWLRGWLDWVTWPIMAERIHRERNRDDNQRIH